MYFSIHNTKKNMDYYASAISPSKNGSHKQSDDSADVVARVYITHDYNKFKVLQGNRDLNLAHINRLSASFKDQQLMIPIIVNENYEVIDGQHRLFVSKELGLPVYYIKCSGYGLKEVQKANTNTSVWTKKNYLESYCRMGYQPYLQFRNFMKQFPDFQISVAGQLLMNSHNINKTSDRGRFMIKDFEEGKLVIKDIDKAMRNARRLLDFKPYYSGFNRKAFVAAMITVFKNKNYDHDTMIKKLKSQPRKLVDMPKASFYIDLIEEIYNYKNRYPVTLRYGK